MSSNTELADTMAKMACLVRDNLAIDPFSEFEKSADTAVEAATDTVEPEVSDGDAALTGAGIGALAGGVSLPLLRLFLERQGLLKKKSKLNTALMGALLGGTTGAGAGLLNNRWDGDRDIVENLVGAAKEDPTVVHEGKEYSNLGVLGDEMIAVGEPDGWLNTALKSVTNRDSEGILGGYKSVVGPAGLYGLGSLLTSRSGSDVAHPLTGLMQGIRRARSGSNLSIAGASPGELSKMTNLHRLIQQSGHRGFLVGNPSDATFWQASNSGGISPGVATGRRTAMQLANRHAMARNVRGLGNKAGLAALLYGGLNTLDANSRLSSIAEANEHLSQLEAALEDN